MKKVSYWFVLFSIIEKEGKAVHIGYEDKTKLVALTQQVIHGPCDPTSVSNVGVLDVVGKDRRFVII